jgi:hypothetical protein
MSEYLVQDPSGLILVIRGWLATESSLDLYAQLKGLLQTMDAQSSGTHTIAVRGKAYKLPRKIFVCADPGVTHIFGGKAFPIYPWLDVILPIRDRIAAELGIRFNSCTINWYPDGTHFIRDHHDSGVKSPRNIILTVSLGATRSFDIKGPITLRTKVNSGDVFMMADAANTNYTHGIPKEKVIPIRGDTGRISLTFRDL